MRRWSGRRFLSPKGQWKIGRGRFDSEANFLKVALMIEHYLIPSCMAITVFNQVPMLLYTLTFPLVIALAIGMYFLLELGSRLGARHLREGKGQLKETLSVIDAPIFALFGLLVAFTFNSSLNRFEGRRNMIVEEANNIGTAYLRLNLLPADDCRVLQQLFREYTDSRIRTYQLIPDTQAVVAEYQRSQNLQKEIWCESLLSVSKSTTPLPGMQLIPALNAMFDITTSRMSAMQFHPPIVIFGMLLAFCLISSLLVGYQLAGMEKRARVHQALFIATITLTCYVILDIEYPRVGLIRMDAADAILRDVRTSFGTPNPNRDATPALPTAIRN